MILNYQITFIKDSLIKNSLKYNINIRYIRSKYPLKKPFILNKKCLSTFLHACMKYLQMLVNHSIFTVRCKVRVNLWENNHLPFFLTTSWEIVTNVINSHIMIWLLLGSKINCSFVQIIFINTLVVNLLKMNF